MQGTHSSISILTKQNQNNMTILWMFFGVVVATLSAIGVAAITAVIYFKIEGKDGK